MQFLDASSPGGAPIDTWAWDFGDGTTSGEASPLKTYTDPGSYTVSLTVTSALGSDSTQRTGLVTVAALAEEIGRAHV